MNILLISRCSKRAREETCRLLDQFAERKGDAAWQTAITREGLDTLRRLLRKTARRNTAVACHWLKKEGRSELLWVVGNPGRFDASGNAPTHRTSRNILRAGDEHGWHSAEAFALLAALAALFHDFGKAGRCFQQTLAGKLHQAQGKKVRFQPYRHEWISLRLFQAFVGEQTDAQWLAKLAAMSRADEKPLLTKLAKDSLTYSDSPLKGLPPLASAVGWLILSHHRLPQSLNGNPEIDRCESWIDRQLTVDWNALNHTCFKAGKIFNDVWTFPAGLPLRSRTWCEKARQIAKRAQNLPSLFAYCTPQHLFTLHMARLTLMLADHHYSSMPAVPAWQDEKYQAWANTLRGTNPVQMNQRLDEHLCGVAHHALLSGRMLPRVVPALPGIARHKGFRERASDARYRWQNSAWDIAYALRERSHRHGFFGVNMASTGCGKTFANARIMYALADERRGCRFSIALGLRTLTLQTGRALEARLGLGDDVLAVLTGSAAVRELSDSAPDDNSASAGALLEAHQYVHYDGTLDSGPLAQWLKKDPRVERLVSAPVLVTTVDHLMPATEGVRGGRQIPAMLRLLSSDLVLDEPDEFDVDDLHSQCRLVHWAGMLGARVLLSSATLPPAQVEALFSAYRAGRQIWQSECGEPGVALNICCAWFDEYGASASDAGSEEAFRLAHQTFAHERARRLLGQPRLRLGEIVPVQATAGNRNAAVQAVADMVMQQILRLDSDHHNTHASGKTVSLGLVRFANINPLVAVATILMAQRPPEGCCIHYCVYHAQQPLAVRSYIEKRLDAAFDRHDPERLWQLPEVKQALKGPVARHIFVVLGTSVMETGRDWSAEWGIAEPSSMRSLIQFPGRIQRHRAITPKTPNLIILSHNINALSGRQPAYCRPGYETTKTSLPSHDLRDLLPESAWQSINAIPRIVEDDDTNAFAELEHRRLRSELMGCGEKGELTAAHWWRAPLTWCAELQRRRPFRRAEPQAQFFIYMEDDDDAPRFMFKTEAGEWKASELFEHCEPELAAGVEPWFDVDYRTVLTTLADERGLELSEVSARYGEITLPARESDGGEPWRYHPLLGVFRAP